MRSLRHLKLLVKQVEHHATDSNLSSRWRYSRTLLQKGQQVQCHNSIGSLMIPIVRASVPFQLCLSGCEGPILLMLCPSHSNTEEACQVHSPGCDHDCPAANIGLNNSC